MISCIRQLDPHWKVEWSFSQQSGRLLHYVQAIDSTILHQQVTNMLDDMRILEIDSRAAQGQ